MVDRVMLLFFTSSWMINHFGKNPVSGGSPPKDSIVIKIIMVVRGSLFHVYDSEVVVVVELSIKREKVVIVIGIYRYRFSNIIVGLYVKMDVIQPM